MVRVPAPPFQIYVLALLSMPAVKLLPKNVTGMAKDKSDPMAIRPVPAKEAAFAVDTAAPNWNASHVPPAVVLLVR
jgi:hypothetical protein